MTKIVTIKCACGCGQTREVREADRKRGWGRYINKSHKAKHQEKRTGQYAAYLERQDGSTPPTFQDSRYSDEFSEF